MKNQKCTPFCGDDGVIGDIKFQLLITDGKKLLPSNDLNPLFLTSKANGLLISAILTDIQLTVDYRFSLSVLGQSIVSLMVPEVSLL